MKCSIWMLPEDEAGLLLEDLTAEEEAELVEAGAVKEAEAEHATSEAAQAWFIDWVKTYKDPDVRTKRVDLKGRLRGD